MPVNGLQPNTKMAIARYVQDNPAQAAALGEKLAIAGSRSEHAQSAREAISLATGITDIDQLKLAGTAYNAGEFNDVFQASGPNYNAVTGNVNTAGAQAVTGGQSGVGFLASQNTSRAFGSQPQLARLGNDIAGIEGNIREARTELATQQQEAMAAKGEMDAHKASNWKDKWFNKDKYKEFKALEGTYNQKQSVAEGTDSHIQGLEGSKERALREHLVSVGHPQYTQAMANQQSASAMSGQYREAINRLDKAADRLDSAASSENWEMINGGTDYFWPGMDGSPGQNAVSGASYVVEGLNAQIREYNRMNPDARLETLAPMPNIDLGEDLDNLMDLVAEMNTSTVVDEEYIDVDGDGVADYVETTETEVVDPAMQALATATSMRVASACRSASREIRSRLARAQGGQSTVASRQQRAETKMDQIEGQLYTAAKEASDN